MNILAKEYALRCKLIDQSENDKGEIEYKFDTMTIGGDYTIIKLPLFFGEDAARYKLFEFLSSLK